MKASSPPQIHIAVRGLSVEFLHDAEETSRIKSRYFTYYQNDFDPKKKRKVRKAKQLEVVHYGAIDYLKRINPEFASRIRIERASSLQEWSPFDLSLLDTIDLSKIGISSWRDSQLDIIKACRNRFISNVVAGMGLGKTLTLIAIAHLSALQGHNVIVTAPTDKIRSTILSNAKLLGLQHFIEYGEIRGGYSGQVGLVIVANSQTLMNDFNAYDTPTMQEFKNSVRTLITDEAHNWTRDSWNQLLVQLQKLYRLVGLSATSVPEHEEGLGFSHINYKTVFNLNACGSVSYRVPREIVELHTDVPEIYCVRYMWDQLKYAKYSSTRNWKVLRELLYHNEDRNHILMTIVRLMQHLNRHIIVPINDKKQALFLMQRLGSPRAVCWFGGKQAYDIHGKINPDRIEEWFKSGKYDVLFASSHIKEGFDLPLLDTIIQQEGKDAIFAQQSSGRIIRKSGNKPILINLYDDFYLFKTHAEERERHVTSYYNKASVRFDSIKQLANHLTTVQ